MMFYAPVSETKFKKKIGQFLWLVSLVKQATECNFETTYKVECPFIQGAEKSFWIYEMNSLWGLVFVQIPFVRVKFKVFVRILTFCCNVVLEVYNFLLLLVFLNECVCLNEIQASVIKAREILLYAQE